MPLTTEQRARIVAAAKTWLGTPYRGWSRAKGGGVDCGQFLAAIFADECGILPKDLKLPAYYSLQVAQHREDTSYLEKVGEYMREITEAEVLPGDIVVYKLALAFAHAAIVISWPEKVCHAIGRHGVCYNHGTNEPRFRKCQRKFFTVKEEYCGEKA